MTSVDELTQTNAQLNQMLLAKDNEIKEAVKSADKVIKEQNADNQVKELKERINELQVQIDAFDEKETDLNQQIQVLVEDNG